MKKIYHKVVKFKGVKNSFMEFGWIENPTFENDIYVWIRANHKRKNKQQEDLWEMQTDEALSLIHGLAMTIQGKLGFGVTFINK